MPNKKWPRVEVRWFDAVCKDGWVKLEEISEPALCISRGWLVKSEDWYITIAATVGDESDDTFGEVITIPRGMIIKIIKDR